MTFLCVDRVAIKKNDMLILNHFFKERKLQEVIEQAYLEYLKEGKFREEFRFATAKHVYNLLFCPTGMYQVNLKTGVKRRVRRRPGKVISSEAIEDLKRFFLTINVFLKTLHIPRPFSHLQWIRTNPRLDIQSSMIEMITYTEYNFSSTSKKFTLKTRCEDEDHFA